MTDVRQASVVTVPDPARAYGFEDLGAEALDRFGYRQQEHLLSGTACGEPFSTRLLVRSPRDPSRASGVTVVEPMHLEGGRPVWSTIHGHLMRSGHAWMEIACQHGPAERMAAAMPERYAAITLMPGDPAQSPVVLGDASIADRDSFIASWWWASPQLLHVCGAALTALRGGAIIDPGPDVVVLAGISQTGGIVRRFARALADGLMPAGTAPDALLACNSGGNEPMASPVPSIELLAEADLESVRAAGGLPGQGRGLLHRQPDSDAFRLYEVAGMAHMDSRTSRRPPPAGKRWSRFPHAEVMAAVLEQLIAWVDRGLPPNSGLTLALEPGSERVARDSYGHAVGGVRTVATDVPRARLEPLGDGGRAFPLGCESPMDAGELIAGYGSEERWSRAAAQRAIELVQARWLRPEDVNTWR
jgi:hypothetical protein